MDREVRLRCWRVPAAELPRDDAAVAAWLDGWWGIFDQWIEAHQPASTTASSPEAPSSLERPHTDGGSARSSTSSISKPIE